MPAKRTGRPELPALEQISKSLSDAVGVLPDDWDTRGNWIGRYGSYAYILCGMGGEHTFSGGSGWDRVPYAYYCGSKDDSARAWMSWCQTDDRALQNPTEFGLVNGVLQRVRYDSIPDGAALPRLPAIWDDHGEAYDKEGPNLCVDLTAPPGLYVLSFYFFEIDWIQHRCFRLNLRKRTWAIGESEERQLGSMLASTTVSDFFEGVHKRFLVRGPQDLQVEIERLDSPNAVLSGVFLDPVIPVYELSHPFAYASDRETRALHAARMPALVQAAYLLDKPPRGDPLKS